MLLCLLAFLTACQPETPDVDLCEGGASIALDSEDPCGEPDAGPAPDAAPAPHAFKLPLAVYVAGDLPIETARAFSVAANTLDGSNRTNDGVFGWSDWGDDGSPRQLCDRIDVVPGDELVVRVEGCRYVVDLPPGGDASEALWLVAESLGAELGGAP